MKQILVKAFWDEEANVWYAQSDDLSGLHVEAATTSELELAIKEAISMLLESDEELSGQSSVPVKLLQERSFTANTGVIA